MRRKNSAYLNFVNCSPWGVTIFLGTPIMTRAWEYIVLDHDTFKHITSGKYFLM